MTALRRSMIQRRPRGALEAAIHARDPATGARLGAHAPRIAQPRSAMPQRVRLVVVICFLATTAAARDPRQLTAVRVAAGAIQIDGSLDDPGWAGVAFSAGFLQKRPVDGAVPSQSTEVAVAFDDTAVIVGVRLTQPPETIRGGLTRRDTFKDLDAIAVSLDTYGDHRTAYTFGITAGGTRFDHYHASDDETDVDPSFDPVWDAATAISPTGWTAELRIPFSQLVALPQVPQRWGINLTRWIAATGEQVYWQLIPSDATGWSSGFGSLVGIDGVELHRRLELLPFVAADATLGARRSLGVRIGGDLKAPVGRSATLQATVLPDFGQVEADPAVLNLTTVETIFDEKRPFFVDNRRMFEGGSIDADTRYFYTRRIGAIPRQTAGTAPTGAPTTDAILGAAKLFGRTLSGLSAGALVALSERTEAADHTPLAPLTAFAIARAQQQLDRRGSTIGVIATGVDRQLAPDDPLAKQLPQTAFAGGADWNLRLGDGDSALSGDVGASRVAGSHDAITLVQQAPAHYLQRPDRSAGSLDPMRTSLSGLRGAIRFDQLAGAHWLGSVEASAISRGFELNDAGILQTADRLNGQATLTYRDNHVIGALRRYQLSLIGVGQWNLERTRVGSRIILNTTTVWRNDWQVDTHVHYEPRAESDQLTRGGPLMATPRMYDSYVNITNSPASHLRYGGELFGGIDELGRRTLELSTTMAYSSDGHWTVSAQPDLEVDAHQRQYVTTIAGGPAATFGQRYVFGELRRNTASLPVRFGYALTANLTLDLYAAPYLTSGRYAGLGELAAPRSLQLRRYGDGGLAITTAGDGYDVVDGGTQFHLAKPDFEQVAFRSTAVVRWEWAPGSTLFVVWQQDRRGGSPMSGVAGPELFGDLFSVPGSHTFAVKLAYWSPWF